MTHRDTFIQNTPIPAFQAVQLVQLWIYPIKSCAGIEVSAAQVTPESGLAGDREWIVVDHENQQIWMGGNPRMALVQPRFEGNGMVLSAPGMESLHVNANVQENFCEVHIWNDLDRVKETFAGADAGDGAAHWLSEVLGQTARLVRLGQAGITRKALLPLHVLSLASVRELNSRLEEQGKSAVEHLRFRPNLVIEGESLSPFAEEGFSSLSWENGMALEFTGGCIRCVMPNISPDDASAGREPLATVTTLSRERGQHQPIFGVYARPDREGILQVGLQGQAGSHQG